MLSTLKNGKQVAIVVSAMGDTTDTLIAHAEKACAEKISPKDLDEILSMGERTSARLFTAALKAQGIEAKYLDPTDDDWPIITDDNYGNADPLVDECMGKIRKKLEPLLNGNIVPVIPGFIGRTARGAITTLGRGGSDTTAFLVAKAIRADEVVLVSDVKGIMSADPKIVPDSKIIRKISVKKLMNLCDFNNKFFHKKALKFLDGSFKVKITSYENEKLENEGTVIQGAAGKDDASIQNIPVASITILAKPFLNTLEIVSDVLKVMAMNRIPLLMLSADADSLVLFVHNKNAQRIAKRLHSNLFLGRKNKILSIAIKEKIAWIKLSSAEIESIYEELEALRKRRKRLCGLLTIASNIHLFTERK